ncbi:MAG: hypothetical protein C0618_10190 [Desulfuromonas sp.]|nr:MAG: hypothetical protein C0618_10190 [Desulfuromonas sp.]
MKIFVAGATGFVGQALLKQLNEQQIEVRCLVRARSRGKTPTFPGVSIHEGDATQAASLQDGLRGCDAVINLIGIIRAFPARGISFQALHIDATRNLIAAAEEQGVGRFVQMSANGVRTGAVTDYHRSKWKAEQTLKASSLDWTIFRPSLIYGPGDQFVNMLAGMIRRLPVIPVLGDGRYQMQPVSVTQVARGFVRALDTDASIGRTYHCGGTRPLSYNDILDQIGAALGKKRVRKLHHPLFLMRPVIRAMEGFSAFPVTTGQLEMLLEGNVCDPSPWQKAFAIEQAPFAEEIATYLTPRS